MPASTRRDDIGSGHDCHFPPSPEIEGSADVVITGKPAMRVRDVYAPHACPTCPAPVHPRKLAQGPPAVEINGRPAGRIGDAIDCGGAARTGSGDMFFDGE